MRSIHPRFRVEYSYAVLTTRGLFGGDSTVLADVLQAEPGSAPRRMLMVLEAEVARLHPGIAAAIEAHPALSGAGVSLVAPPWLLEGGEALKNHPTVIEELLDRIHEAKLCRHSFVMAVGGGALLDAVGLAAALAHRGIRLIRVPSTVLAQCDAGIGVKNGINRFGTKNFIGTFAVPFAVINDGDLLVSLSDRDWRAGLAEAVKVALLKDPDFFTYLETVADRLLARDLTAMQEVIHRCAQLHLDHIAGSGDPFETGSSRPLDLGHWSAHKLEQLSGFTLRHGEAVAIGLCLDATYSYRLGMLSETAWERILALIAQLGLPLSCPELPSRLDRPEDPGSLLHGLAEFREHLGGRLTVPLLREIGRPCEVNAMEPQRLVECIGLLEALAHAKGGSAWRSIAPAP